MAIVISCETSKNGMLQAVKLRVGKSQMLQRPVNKTVLLLGNQMVQFPDEKSHTYRKHLCKILESWES